jgi:hypothetical protein
VNVLFTVYLGCKEMEEKIGLIFIWSYFHIAERQMRFVQMMNKTGYQYCVCTWGE